MIRALFRLVLLVVLVVGVAAFFFGYRWRTDGSVVDRPTATSGSAGPIDATRARRAGAEVGEVVARSANEAQRAAADVSLTTKIKAKMALDDHVKALNIDIDATGSVVTLSGHVGSEDERSRAVKLARETDGVTSVSDHLIVGR